MFNNNTEYSRVNPVSADAVDLNDIKNFLRIGNDLENEFLKKIIVLAIEYIEWYLNISITTQEWKAIVHEELFAINLKYPPIQQITEVKYEEYPNLGKWKIYEKDKYKLQNNRLLILDSLSTVKRIIVQYTAGYTKLDNTPYPIKENLYRYIFALYTNRDNLDNLNKIRKEFNQFKNFNIIL